MHFDLNLAIAYACTMGLFMWLAFWFVPALFGALVRSTARAVRALRSRNEQPPRGPSDEPWWGPFHHSH